MRRARSSHPGQPIRVALYCRTSRSGQHIDAQLAQLRQVADQRGWVVVGEFIDDEVSSRRKHRPQFAAMSDAARKGGLDVIAACALDRYARSVRELLDLSERAERWGVDLISLRESIDTSTAVGKMTFTVLAAVAEFERELIRERTLVGLDGARRRGKRLGRPTVNVDVLRLAQKRARGVPWPTLAAELGASEATLRRALRAHRASLSKTSSETAGEVPESALAEDGASS